MSKQSQTVCLWAGLSSIVLFFIGYWFMAGLVPPPSPNATAHAIQRFWNHDVTLTRSGLVVTMFAGTLTAPWVAVIAVQMKRIEGEHSPYTWTQLGLGMLGVLLFILPAIVMQAILFRPQRDPNLLLLLDDMAWLPFIGLFMPASVQSIALGLAIFQDKEQKVFPRWLGYFNIWIALLFLPDVLIYSFKTGPFAWNGIFGFWLPLSTFGVWFVVMFPYLRKAIRAQAAEESPAGMAASPVAVTA
ncbi:MAG TPA: hypothetical protein VG223_00730 [Solirubrobacteraceae bacterium]|jgi:hypothetical protein|nr:hypothetical protein [Solirubrobacteraceae bacterium]